MSIIRPGVYVNQVDLSLPAWDQFGDAESLRQRVEEMSAELTASLREKHQLEESVDTQIVEKLRYETSACVVFEGL